MIVYALNKSCLRLIWHIKASVKQFPSNVHHYLLFYHSHQLFSTEKSTQASLPECCQSSSCYTTRNCFWLTGFSPVVLQVQLWESASTIWKLFFICQAVNQINIIRRHCTKKRASKSLLRRSVKIRSSPMSHEPHFSLYNRQFLKPNRFPQTAC